MPTTPECIIYIEDGQVGKLFKTYSGGDDAAIEAEMTQLKTTTPGIMTDGTLVSEAHRINPASLNAQGEYLEGPIVESYGKAPGVVNETIDPGRLSLNILRVASNVANTETVTIGEDVYEFYNDAGPTAGRIGVDVTGDLTPTNATTKLVAAINASGTERVTAKKISNNEVLIFQDEAGLPVLACAETLGGANNAWAAANTYGGRADGPRRISVQKRVPLAVEVALGNMHFQFDFPPKTVFIDVSVTATPGLAKDWLGTYSIDGNLLTVNNGGGTDWAATDTLTVIVTD